MELTQEELKKRCEADLKRIIKLMVERNTVYSTTDITQAEATANFRRNAVINEVYRIKKIIDEPYGVSIQYVLQKIDRLVNGILKTLDIAKKLSSMCPPIPFSNLEGPFTYLKKYPKHASIRKTIIDSIDDSIVYLLLTKRILEEQGL